MKTQFSEPVLIAQVFPLYRLVQLLVIVSLFLGIVGLGKTICELVDGDHPATPMTRNSVFR